MAWTSIIESGSRVVTPHGEGTVQRYSENNESYRVEVNGQLFEVDKSDVASVPKPEGTPVPVGHPVQPGNVKVGDRVKSRINGREGEIIKVTQRSVTAKWDDSGNVTNFKKNEVGEHLFKGDKPTEEHKEEEKEEKKEDTRTDDEKQTDIADGLYGLLNLKKKLENKIESEVDGELKELREEIKRKQTLEVKVGSETNTVTGLKHKQLEQLINYCALRLSPLLVGMAGTGKTHAGTQVASALGLKFYAISVGAQTTKTDIMGYMDASGRYIRTLFRQAYEHGGVFLMDEIDAGNANVLITINAALANGVAAFPDGMVPRHEDFVFIASANTFGNGANRQYVGRNQLDAATLDRFALINWDIDDELEKNLAFGLNGEAWYTAVKAARDYVAEHNIRALISPRATQKGSALLDIGTPIEEVIEATMLGSVPEDKKQDVRQVAKTVFEKHASNVPNTLPTEVNPPTAADLIKGDWTHVNTTFTSTEIPF